jgi:hypothetical protein
MPSLTHGNIALPMPAGWEDHSQLVVVGPSDGGARPNLVVTREKAPAGLTAVAAAQRAWSAAKQAVPSLALVEEGEEALGANKGFLREQTFVDGARGKVQQLVFFVVKGASLYTAVVTHSAARFDSFHGTAESLLAQLKLA